MAITFSTDQLRRISTLIPADDAVNDINAILDDAGCTTYERAAMLLGQMAIESDYFRTMVESPDSYAGKAYPPYYGRTWIQLTWVGNYRLCGAAIGVDLVSNPDLALQHNADIVAWFWNSKRLNDFADRNDCDGCTRAINGQGATLASLSLRAKYYNRALQVLNGCAPGFEDVTGGSSSSPI